MSRGVDIAENVGSIWMTRVDICLLVALVVALQTHCENVRGRIVSSRQELTYYGRAGRPRGGLGGCELPNLLSCGGRIESRELVGALSLSPGDVGRFWCFADLPCCIRFHIVVCDKMIEVDGIRSTK